MGGLRESVMGCAFRFEVGGSQVGLEGVGLVG